VSLLGDILQNWIDEPWAVALTVASIILGFLAWLFREVIKELLVGRLRSRRERAQQKTAAGEFYSEGEREILAALVRTGGYVIVSGRELIEGRKDLVRLVNLTNEYRIASATHSDVLSLSRRGLIDGTGGHATRLTERGKDEGQRLVGLFGVSSFLDDAKKAKD